MYCLGFEEIIDKMWPCNHRLFWLPRSKSEHDIILLNFNSGIRNDWNHIWLCEFRPVGVNFECAIYKCLRYYLCFHSDDLQVYSYQCSCVVLCVCNVCLLIKVRNISTTKWNPFPYFLTRSIEVLEQTLISICHNSFHTYQTHTHTNL